MRNIVIKENNSTLLIKYLPYPCLFFFFFRNSILSVFRPSLAGMVNNAVETTLIGRHLMVMYVSFIFWIVLFWLYESRLVWREKTAESCYVTR